MCLSSESLGNDIIGAFLHGTSGSLTPWDGGVLAPSSSEQVEASRIIRFLCRAILSFPIPSVSQQAPQSLSSGGGLMTNDACWEGLQGQNLLQHVILLMSMSGELAMWQENTVGTAGACSDSCKDGKHTQKQEANSLITSVTQTKRTSTKCCKPNSKVKSVACGLWQ